MSFDLPLLPDGWQYITLEALSQEKSITYGVVQPGAAVSEGVPIIRVNNFKDGRLELSDVMHIAPEVESKYGRTRLAGGEVLLTIVGSVGQVAVVPKILSGFNVARAVAVIHPIEEVSANWIAICLRSPLAQHLLGSRANTTVQTTINLKDLRALPVPLPPVAVRQVIEELIYSLDDRIALLRETNATLEAMAQALFKSWFVDFDPVHANAGTRAATLPAELQALFPSTFIDTPQGLVPAGWGLSTIGESFILTMGQSPPGDTYNESGIGLPFYQGRTDFGFRFPTQRVFCTAPTRLAQQGDVLVSVRAPVGDVNVALEQCALGRGVASVRHPEGHCSFTFYMLCTLKSKFELYNGEGTVFGSINKKDFQSLTVVAPLENVIAAFEGVASSIDARVEVNEHKIRTLATLRDTLLPRLISGQLRLPDAEAALVEAGV